MMRQCCIVRKLVLSGFEDWRLPTARELRSIIKGYAGTESKGSCKIGNSAGTSVTFEDGWGGGDCGYAASLAGPGRWGLLHRGWD